MRLAILSGFLPWPGEFLWRRYRRIVTRFAGRGPGRPATA